MKQAGFLRILTGGLTTDTSMPAVLNACSVFEKRNIANKWRTLSEVLSTGMSFGDAVASFPELLPPEAIGLANAGLSRQQLAAAYHRLATTIADDRAGSRAESTTNDASFGNMAFYAAVYFIVVSALFSFLCLYILPKYRAIFEGLGVPLPMDSLGNGLMSGVGVAFIPGGFALFASLWFSVSSLVYFRFWGHGIHPSDPLYWWAMYFPRHFTPNILRFHGEVVEARRSVSEAAAILVQLPILPAIRGPLSRVDAAVQSGEDIWSALRSERFLNTREMELLTLATKLGNVRSTAFELARLIEARRGHRRQILYRFSILVFIAIMIIPIVVFVSVFFLPLIALFEQLNRA
jgi:type II secretory pathway component PulF